MKRTKFLLGLNILSKYYNETNEYSMGAEHDQFYAYATDHPLSEEDFKKMIEHNWFQPDAYDNNFKQYLPGECWSAYL